MSATAFSASVDVNAVRTLTPAEALAVWNNVIGIEDATFFDDYPRDGGRRGPFEDDEKVRIIREVFLSDDQPWPDGRRTRAEVVRAAARRVGIEPRQAPTTPPVLLNRRPGSMGLMMSLGMVLTEMIASGRTTAEALEKEPALWFHGAKSPLSGDPVLDRALITSSLAWARCGFPRVVLASHRLAAGMMWIDATRGVSGVAAPWDAFWIAIPNNLVRHTSSSSGEVDVTDGFVHIRPGGSVVAYFGDSATLSLQVLRPSLATLAHTEGIGADWAERHVDSHLLTGLVGCVDPPSDVIAAATEMLANLVLSVCVDMTAHRPAPATTRRSVGSKKAREAQSPVPTDYIIERRAVFVGDPGAEDVNCINTVREYVRDPSATRSSATQRIHRAHYQLQTWGPRNSLRRLQLHRAYRQGPAEAPIAVRSHVRRSTL